jgi:hypothetical protein
LKLLIHVECTDGTKKVEELNDNETHEIKEQKPITLKNKTREVKEWHKVKKI